MGEYERAAEAFGVAISLNPNFPAAHRRLAILLAGRLTIRMAEKISAALSPDAEQGAENDADRPAARQR